MKLKIIALCTAFLVCGLLVMSMSEAQNTLSPWRIVSGSVSCGAAGAAALAVQFNSITIRADPSNAGSICIGGSTVTCTHAAAAATTDGIKLRAGDSITISGGQWKSGTLYLNNTAVDDDFSYIALY